MHRIALAVTLAACHPPPPPSAPLAVPGEWDACWIDGARLAGSRDRFRILTAARPRSLLLVSTRYPRPPPGTPRASEHSYANLVVELGDPVTGMFRIAGVYEEGAMIGHVVWRPRGTVTIRSVASDGVDLVLTLDEPAVGRFDLVVPRVATFTECVGRMRPL